MHMQAIKRCRTPGCPTTGAENFYEGCARCKTCICARVRAHRQANAERLRAYDRARARTPTGEWRSLAWQLANPERKLVTKRNSQRVRRAIRAGLLVMGTACASCARADVPLEAAHFDYAKPLVVVWLCRPCHRRWDAGQPKSDSALRESPALLRQRHQPTFDHVLA